VRLDRGHVEDAQVRTLDRVDGPVFEAELGQRDAVLELLAQELRRQPSASPSALRVD
jgi:hypothetical protein